MIANQRHLFDIPEGVAYLNCAARTPLLEASKAAGETGMGRELDDGSSRGAWMETLNRWCVGYLEGIASFLYGQRIRCD